MFEVEKLKSISILDGGECSQALVDPVALPCGNTVCKWYLDELQSKAVCVTRQKIDFWQKNAEPHTEQYFDDAMRDVDLRREEVKARVDLFSEELLSR